MLSERPSSDLTFRAPHSLVPGVSLSLLNNLLSIAVFFRRCTASQKNAQDPPGSAAVASPLPLSAPSVPPPLHFQPPSPPINFRSRFSPFSNSGYRSPAPQTERLYPAPPPTASPRWHQSCWVFALPFAFLVPGTRIGALPLHSPQCIEHIVSDPLDSSGPTLTC
jgi:hypothetical protein